MILAANRNYFLNQNLHVDLCNGEELLFFFEVRTEFLNII
jgi:hypothetical protein